MLYSSLQRIAERVDVRLDELKAPNSTQNIVSVLDAFGMLIANPGLSEYPDQDGEYLVECGPKQRIRFYQSGDDVLLSKADFTLLRDRLRQLDDFETRGY